MKKKILKRLKFVNGTKKANEVVSQFYNGYICESFQSIFV